MYNRCIYTIYNNEFNLNESFLSILAIIMGGNYFFHHLRAGPVPIYCCNLENLKNRRKIISDLKIIDFTNLTNTPFCELFIIPSTGKWFLKVLFFLYSITKTWHLNRVCRLFISTVNEHQQNMISISRYCVVLYSSPLKLQQQITILFLSYEHSENINQNWGFLSWLKFVHASLSLPEP